MRIRGCGIAHREPGILVAQDRDPRLDHLIDGAHRPKRSRDAGANDLRQSAHIGCHDGYAARERLECAQPERFVETRQQKELGARQQRRHRVELAEEEHRALDSEKPRLLLGLGAIGSVADHEEHAR